MIFHVACMQSLQEKSVRTHRSSGSHLWLILSPWPFFAQNIWPQLMYILLLINTNTTRRWRKVMVVISKTIEEWCMGSWPLDIVSKMVFVFCVRDNTCVLCNSFVQRHSHIWWWSHTYGTHLHISRMRVSFYQKKENAGYRTPRVTQNNK